MRHRILTSHARTGGPHKEMRDINHIEQAPPELGRSALEHYTRHGWTFVPGFFSATQTTQLVQFTDEVCALPELAGRQMLYREPSLLDAQARVIQRIENFCPFHVGFDQLIRGHRLQSAVEQLLGDPAVLFKEKINFKISGGAGFEPHQDQQAGWSVYAPLFVTALVSIDAATLENGCLEIANCPRSSGLIGREWAPLSASEMAGFDLQPVATRPGDVIFFDSYVPHGSGPNLSSEQRRVLYVTYNRASDGDHRSSYYANKRASFPPDNERLPGIEYRFRV
jgi:2-aminoethylphosphonate dioxygenase